MFEYTKRQAVRRIHFIYSVPGVTDYCERYGANIETVSRGQASVRSWSGPTVEHIHNEMCKTIPVEKLDTARMRRDQKLTALAVYRNSEANK